MAGLAEGLQVAEDESKQRGDRDRSDVIDYSRWDWTPSKKAVLTQVEITLQRKQPDLDPVLVVAA